MNTITEGQGGSKVANLNDFNRWFKFNLNDLNLQVVAVGCYDVAAEVAVAAVVGYWKGFREGFPAKGCFVKKNPCGKWNSVVLWPI